LNFLTWSLKYLNESYIISNTESHLIETLKQLRRSRNTILVQTSRPGWASAACILTIASSAYRTN